MCHPKRCTTDETATDITELKRYQCVKPLGKTLSEMMTPSAISSLIHTVFVSDTPAEEALATIYYMDIHIRKAFLTICRTQSMPDQDSTVLSRLAHELQTSFEIRYGPDLQGVTTLQEVVQPLRNYLQSPFISGLISMLIRNIPYNDLSSVRDTFESGLAKEIGAAMEEYRPYALNWDAVMSHDRNIRRKFSIHHEYGCKPHINDHIYKSLRSVVPGLIRNPIYPVIGAKTIGQEAFREVLQTYQGWRFEEFDVTPSVKDLERIYSRTGVLSVGVTELRWAWKYNDLKPRIYYARGPTVYHASKYIQPVYNLLLDTLPTTNRRERFDARSVMLLDQDRLFIYDYESFTSLFEEIKNFNLAMSRFFSGVVVTLIDTFLGPVQVDLGEVFDHYHSICSMYSPVDIAHCSWDRVKVEDPSIIYHTCGMLGVPGNISSCTLAHGIHLIELLGDLSCKVVGDDAIGSTIEGPKEVLDKLRNIGRIQESKVESWEGESKEPDQGLELHTWHYVKRPILRIANRVIQGFQMIFPPVADFLGIHDEFHTVKDHSDRIQFLQQRCNILISFCVQMLRFPQKPTEVELDIIQGFYSILRSSLFREKRRMKTHAINLHLLPSHVKCVFDFDEWFHEFSRTVTLVPVEKEIEWEPTRLGENFGLMSKPLHLAETLGYGETRLVTRRMVPEDDKDFFHRMLLKSGPIRSLYSYRLYPSCPDWLVDLVFDKSLKDDPTGLDDLFGSLDMDESDEEI